MHSTSRTQSMNPSHQKKIKNLIGEKITRSKERNRERTLHLVVRERSEIKEEKGGKRSTHCERHDGNGKRSSLGLSINKSSVLDPSTTKQERREKKDLWQSLWDDVPIGIASSAFWRRRRRWGPLGKASLLFRSNGFALNQTNYEIDIYDGPRPSRSSAPYPFDSDAIYIGGGGKWRRREIKIKKKNDLLVFSFYCMVLLF